MRFWRISLNSFISLCLIELHLSSSTSQCFHLIFLSFFCLILSCNVYFLCYITLKRQLFIINKRCVSFTLGHQPSFHTSTITFAVFQSVIIISQNCEKTFLNATLFIFHPLIPPLVSFPLTHVEQRASMPRCEHAESLCIDFRLKHMYTWSGTRVHTGSLRCFVYLVHLWGCTGFHH